MQQPPSEHVHVEHDEIEYSAIGDEGRPARREVAGLMLYVVSLAGFLFWLLRYGVNV